MSTRADTSELALDPTDAPRVIPRMPVAEALVWLCALAGLSAYTLTGIFPQLLAR